MADFDDIKTDRKLKSASKSMPAILRSPPTENDHQRCGQAGNDLETKPDAGQKLCKTCSSFQIGERGATENASRSKPTLSESSTVADRTPDARKL